MRTASDGSMKKESGNERLAENGAVRHRFYKSARLTEGIIVRVLPKSKMSFLRHPQSALSQSPPPPEHTDHHRSERCGEDPTRRSSQTGPWWQPCLLVEEVPVQPFDEKAIQRSLERWHYLIVSKLIPIGALVQCMDFDIPNNMARLVQKYRRIVLMVFPMPYAYRWEIVGNSVPSSE